MKYLSASDTKSSGVYSCQALSNPFALKQATITDMKLFSNALLIKHMAFPRVLDVIKGGANVLISVLCLITHRDDQVALQAELCTISE